MKNNNESIETKIKNDFKFYKNFLKHGEDREIVSRATSAIIQLRTNPDRLLTQIQRNLLKNYNLKIIYEDNMFLPIFNELLTEKCKIEIPILFEKVFGWKINYNKKHRTIYNYLSLFDSIIEDYINHEFDTEDYTHETFQEFISWIQDLDKKHDKHFKQEQYNLYYKVMRNAFVIKDLIYISNDEETFRKVYINMDKFNKNYKPLSIKLKDTDYSDDNIDQLILLMTELFKPIIKDTLYPQYSFVFNEMDNEEYEKYKDQLNEWKSMLYVEKIKEYNYAAETLLRIWDLLENIPDFVIDSDEAPYELTKRNRNHFIWEDYIIFYGAKLKLLLETYKNSSYMKLEPFNKKKIRFVETFFGIK